MRGATFLLLTVGCGRIYFDPLVSDDGGSAGDGTDNACTRVETCNGIDDNCDNIIDDGCPCAPFSVAIGTGQAVGAAFTGAGWLAVRDPGADAEVVRLDTSGAEQDRWVPSPGVQVEYVAWTGSHLALLRKQNTNLSLSFVDALGVASAPVPVTSEAVSSSTAFGSRGAQLAIVWESPVTTIVGWFDDQGTPLGAPIELTPAHATVLWQARIASRHDGWAITWTDDHQAPGETHAHVSFFDIERQLLRTYDLGESGSGTSIAATATGYAMVFDQPNVMTLVAFDSVGNVVRPAALVQGMGTTSGGAKLGWGGSLRAAWTGNFGIGSGIQATTAFVDTGSLTSVEALSGNIQATGGSLSMRDVHATADRTGIVWSYGFSTTPTAMQLTQRCP